MTDDRYVPDALALTAAMARADGVAVSRISHDIISAGDPRRSLLQLAGLVVSLCSDLDRAAGHEFALAELMRIGATVEAEGSCLRDAEPVN